VVAATLEIEEAALTGESLPVGKQTEPVEGDDVPLGDRICMAYMNTSVTRGRGEFVVTETGMATEIGHIANMLANTETEKTPLQKQLDGLSKGSHRSPGSPSRSSSASGCCGTSRSRRCSSPASRLPSRRSQPGCPRS
jgi:hypothetical protein